MKADILKNWKEVAPYLKDLQIPWVDEFGQPTQLLLNPENSSRPDSASRKESRFRERVPSVSAMWCGRRRRPGPH